MQTTDAVVRLQALGGAWETCGVDRQKGIRPEDIQLTSNEWGNDTANFTLRRDPKAVWPDLSAFTPVEVEIGGVTVWEGFINQTPSNESDGGTITVQCKGWQYHLDDDSIEKAWAHSNLADWREAKSSLSTNLVYFPPGTSVSAGEGALSAAWSKGSEAKQNTFAAAILDLGDENVAREIMLSWEVPTGGSYGTSSGMTVTARSSNSLSDIHTSSASVAVSVNMGALGSATTGYSGTFATPGRYVLLGLQFTNATVAAVSADYLARFTAVMVFASTTASRWTGTMTTTGGADATFTTTTGTLTAGMTVTSSNVPVGTTILSVSGSSLVLSQPASALNTQTCSAVYAGVAASTVVKDVLTKAPLLNQSTTGITTTTFPVPHLAGAGGQSPREYITSVNAYHNYIAKVAAERVLQFGPLPSSPSLTAGNWSGSTLSTASVNSGEEIYNRVVVEGTNPSGDAIRVSQSAPAIASSSSKIDRSALLTNAAMASNVTGWTASSGSTFVFGTFYGSGGNWNFSSANIRYTLTGTMVSGNTFFAGTSYTLLIPVSGDESGRVYTTTFGSSTDNAVTRQIVSNSNFVVTWTPKANTSSANVTVTIQFTPYDPNYGIHIAPVSITTAGYSLPDKRGFVRTKRLQVTQPITSDIGATIGKYFLQNHVSTPFKGDLDVSVGGLRDYNSGYPVHPSLLLLRTTELIHFSNQLDPNTGAQGRDGRIASVSYSHSNQSAQVSIDNQRNRFEKILARLSVVTNNRLGR